MLRFFLLFGLFDCDDLVGFGTYCVCLDFDWLALCVCCGLLWPAICFRVALADLSCFAWLGVV